jgi:hypothetical protein
MVGCGSAPLLQGCVSNSADRQGQTLLQRIKKAEAAFQQQEHLSLVESLQVAAGVLPQMASAPPFFNTLWRDAP